MKSVLRILRGYAIRLVLGTLTVVLILVAYALVRATPPGIIVGSVLLVLAAAGWRLTRARLHPAVRPLLHELRAPLATITTAVELLRQHPEEHAAIKSISQAVRQARQIIDDITEADDALRRGPDARIHRLEDHLRAHGAKDLRTTIGPQSVTLAAMDLSPEEFDRIARAAQTAVETIYKELTVEERREKHEVRLTLPRDH